MSSTAKALRKEQVFAHRVVEFADKDKCISYFEQNQIDFMLQNDQGWTILMSICACGRDDLVGYVIDHMSHLQASTSTNLTTALHLAAMNSNEKVFQQLVETKERQLKIQEMINLPNKNGDTPLMMACVAKNVIAVEELLKLGANASYVNANGISPLICAVRIPVVASNEEDPKVIQNLQERSGLIIDLLVHMVVVDVNQSDLVAGNTPLHVAILSQNQVAYKKLLTVDDALDLQVRNHQGQTARDLLYGSSMKKKQELLDLFETKWKLLEEQVQAMSLFLEEQEEQEDLVVTTKNIKTNKSKSKKKKKTSDTETNNSRSTTTAELVKNEAKDSEEKEEEVIKSQEDTIVVEQEELEGEWKQVERKDSKKNKSKNAITTTKMNNNKSHHSTQEHHTKTKSKKNPTTTTPPVRPKSPIQSKTKTVEKLPVPLPPPPMKASGSIPVPTPPLSPSSERSQEKPTTTITTSSSTSSSPLKSYEFMDVFFKKYFPIALEMEIDVEHFVMGPFLEMNDQFPLSISQLEMIQEAHLVAYHQLNERKLELIRLLEQQRLEEKNQLEKQLFS